MTVSDVMTFGVASVSQEARLVDAARTLLDYRISGMPVVESAGRLMGFISDGDIARSMAEDFGHPGGRRRSEPGRDRAAEPVRVKDAMTARVHTVDRDASVTDAVQQMVEHGFRGLPVLHDGRVVGMFSRPDFIRYLLDADRATPE